MKRRTRTKKLTLIKVLLLMFYILLYNSGKDYCIETIETNAKVDLKITEFTNQFLP